MGEIVSHYDALLALSWSPVTALNRAVAVSMAGDPESALAEVDRLAEDRRLKDYHLLPGVRGDLLEKLGRGEEAACEFRRAAGMTSNAQEKSILERRASDAAAA